MNNTSNQKKYFIADATCPNCAALDKIYIIIEEEKQTSACTQCDFQSSIDFSKTDLATDATQAIPTANIIAKG